jgi:hypothetical protein
VQLSFYVVVVAVVEGKEEKKRKEGRKVSVAAIAGEGIIRELARGRMVWGKFSLGCE